MFVRVETRRRRHVPWTTLFVFFACLASFVVLATLPPEQHLRVLMRWGTVPKELLGASGWSWEALQGSRPVTLLTALFMHADWLHLVGNLVFLLIFGLSAERLLGSRRFLALFLICGALANLAGAWVLGTSSAPIVGASGAVSAIVGAYLLLLPGAKLGIVIPLGVFLEFVRLPASLVIGFWALLQVIFSFVGPAFGAVAWIVHLAGFLAGIVFALVSRPAIARRLRA
jgi:membrane associated rhomboid family serine protease